MRDRRPRGRRKPSVKTRCVANFYSAPNERIVEVSNRHGAGCLIAIREYDNGDLSISVYRQERCTVLPS